MSKVYKAQELIEILRSERQACLKGDRLKLEVSISGNPLIDQFIRTEGLQKFTAYQDFKAAIHEYQREQQVSGVIWRSVTAKGKTLSFPEVDAQLIALPSDLDTIKEAKDNLIKFWNEVTVDMDLFLSTNHGKQHQRISIYDIERIVRRTEWATISAYEKGSFVEIILQLGWGQPAEACYKRGWPNSGSEYIHAVIPGNLPIG
jgi:hypothetical protein